MKAVTIHDARTNLSRLIKKACEGEEIIITRDSQPVALLIALAKTKGHRKPGSLKGKLRIGPEFFEPLPESQSLEWQ